MCQRLVCRKREFAVRFHFRVNFNDPKFKNEFFMRTDMKHSYFSNYFIICLQPIFLFSAVETVVCQKFMHNFCSSCIKKF